MYEIKDITCLAGVEPDTDRTSFATPHYVFADKIRFIAGFPEKIGGWDIFTLESGQQIEGCPRTYFSYILNDRVRAIIGTNSHLYSLIASQLTNITPLDTDSEAIPDSLDTYYLTLGSDPLTTIDDSSTITISDANTKVRVGDSITLSGATTTNGIPDTEINATHVVRIQTTNSFSIMVATAATSSGTGGGGSIDLATGILTVNQLAHGLNDGDNIKIEDATDVGGILAADINTIFRIRNATTNTYDIVTEGEATSSVTAAGGSSTIVFLQIQPGSCDAFLGQGYGMGRYGVGLYGVSKTSSAPTLPRIWSVDKFGDLAIMTPGDGGHLYSWNGSTATLPEVVTNSPDECNYVFTTNNIAVVLGADLVDNRIKWSDQGNLTVWTPSATNQAGEDDIEGADRFISQCNVRGVNLLFTPTKTYLFSYIGSPLVFSTQLLAPTIGLIAQNARAVYQGVAYWMGNDNFYMYDGGNVQVIPSNSKQFSTILKYVFGNMSSSQQSKTFAWVNEQFREIWWHYPSANSNEPDQVVRYNVQENTWTMDTMERTAAEYPDILLTYPRLLDIVGNIYRHENGYNDVNLPLRFQLTTKYFDSGTRTLKLAGVIPDSTQNEDIVLEVNSKLYPQQDPPLTNGPYVISPDTTRFGQINCRARLWQYDISGEELDQYWRAGNWQQEVKSSTRR